MKKHPVQVNGTAYKNQEVHLSLTLRKTTGSTLEQQINEALQISITTSKDGPMYSMKRSSLLNPDNDAFKRS